MFSHPRIDTLDLRDPWARLLADINDAEDMDDPWDIAWDWPELPRFLKRTVWLAEDFNLAHLHQYTEHMLRLTFGIRDAMDANKAWNRAWQSTLPWHRRVDWPHVLTEAGAGLAIFVCAFLLVWYGWR